NISVDPSPFERKQRPNAVSVEEIKRRMRSHHQQGNGEMSSESWRNPMHDQGEQQRENDDPRNRVRNAAMIGGIACRSVELEDEIDIRKTGGNDRGPGCPRSPALETAARHAQADQSVSRVKHLSLTSGPPTRLQRYTAARSYHCWSVPPRL